MRVITFSDYRAHTSPLFKSLNLLNLQYRKGSLPVDFDNLFTEIKNVHQHNTRLASKTITYMLPLPRTNYGIFNIKFSGPKIWNSLDDLVKTLNLKNFKKQFKNQFIDQYE